MFRARQGRRQATKIKLQLRVANLSERQQSWLKGSGPASPVENKRTKATRKSVKKTDHAAPKPTATKAAPKKKRCEQNNSVQAQERGDATRCQGGFANARSHVRFVSKCTCTTVNLTAKVLNSSYFVVFQTAVFLYLHFY